MEFAYPMILHHANKETILVFPDFPEIVSWLERDTISSADPVAIGQEALLDALQARVDFDDVIPEPSADVPNATIVRVSPAAAIKLALYRELHNRKVARSQFAKTLRIRQTEAQRLFDLRHESRSDQVQNAFAELGLEVTVHVGIQPRARAA